MKRLLTVRSSYLYIVVGSALLSGISLFIVYRAFVFLYSHNAPDSFLVRLSHWLMNHIGKTPIAVLIFLTVFTGIFMLRSQKTADDVKSLLSAAEELAEKGSFEELEVMSGGELRELAAHLHRINRTEAFSANDLQTSNMEKEASGILLGNEEVMALILRMKSLLRILDDGEVSGDDPERTERLRVEAVKREALGVERFLESLMTSS
ncbi:hypothetical protein P4H66_16915 [Paenibacillus dokdonensis]|uniref:HAMP domain-containing protein n=1 Tax=Paenibacillus dokdonensis TaxID=2567944 RepID=A0ABU6GP66_9BACL|nr:hypothetical protein [Paenibacillus dokdonensis]MEC0241500.1 hypothetical protein [Paenibacillus dokdonensis]